MKTNRTLRNITRAFASSVCVLWLVGACGGATLGTPVMGSESHFLMHCTDSCGGGLECIGSICTKACLPHDDSCSSLLSNAACTYKRDESGEVAVCDLDCGVAADCSALGTEYACESGFCRAPALGQGPLSNDDVPDSNGGSSGTGDQGPVRDDGDPDSDGTPVECADYADQTPRPVVHGVTLVNTGTETLYLQDQKQIGTCSGFEQQLVGVTRMDPENWVPIRVNGVGCANVCQSVINDGWTPPERSPEYEGSLETNTCPVDCELPHSIPLEPGQTLFEAARAEWVPQRLPQECAEGIVTDGINCYQRVLPAPAEYQLSVKLEVPPNCGDGPECVVLIVTQTAEDWFYGDQTFELKLPQ